jgi:hypothetical protein
MDEFDSKVLYLVDTRSCRVPISRRHSRQSCPPEIIIIQPIRHQSSKERPSRHPRLMMNVNDMLHCASSYLTMDTWAEITRHKVPVSGDKHSTGMMMLF